MKAISELVAAGLCEVADDLETYFERDAGKIKQLGMDAYIEQLRGTR